ncbi:hypothetical protein CPB97_005698, partial [Podila verticillata]
MKITASVAILALAASQAMAVVPVPVPECTKSVIVRPTDNDGCAAFASRWGTTFDNLLKWNLKLRPDCMNLDEGHPICVSVTPGAGTLEPRPTGPVPPVPSVNPPVNPPVNPVNPPVNPVNPPVNPPVVPSPTSGAPVRP